MKKEESSLAALNDKQQPAEGGNDLLSFYTGAYRVATCLAKSDLVPSTFQGRPENCMIALEMAGRIGASPLMVMQNLYLVHGKPAWSSQFLVACINASGKFTPLRYRMTGEKGKDTYGCVAWAKDSSGEVLESPEITIGMAKNEGWYSKSGSKWVTMPELMLRYRCATLFARLYAPELTMGIQTAEEVTDITPAATDGKSRFAAAKVLTDAPRRGEPAEAKDKPEKTDLEKLAELIDRKGIPVTAEAVRDWVTSRGEIFSYDMVAPSIDAIAGLMLSGADSGEAGK